MSEFDKTKKKLKFYHNLSFILVAFLPGRWLYSDYATDVFFWKILLSVNLVLIAIDIILLYKTRSLKCVRCRKDIKSYEIIKMDSFACPHCGNIQFEDKPVKIWFK